jgi:hypothetical protein
MEVQRGYWIVLKTASAKARLVQVDTPEPMKVR